MAFLPYTLPTTLPGAAVVPAAVTTSAAGGADGTLHEVTSACDGGLALLIAQYEESPRLRALICSYLDRAQETDHGLVQVYELGLDVDAAEGEALDLLGRIVREARDGRADYEYRRGVRTRIRINRSQGRREDLIAIVRLFEEMSSDPAAKVRIQELQPARAEVRVDGSPVNRIRDIHSRLRRAKAAGVALQTMGLETGTRATAFRLIRASAYPQKSAIGLKCITDGTPAGGVLSHVLA